MATNIDRGGVAISDLDLARLERQTGVRLPPQYRDFLLKNNGGRPTPCGFHIPGEEGSGLLKCFFVVGEHPHFSFDLYLPMCKGRLPRDVLPIGMDVGGNLICLAVSDGGVLFWDHEEEADEGEEPTYDNITKLADDLQTFLDGLHEPDRSTVQCLES